MIQRIQTLFFALVALLQAVFAFVSVAHISFNDEIYTVYIYKILNQSGEVLQHNWGVGVLNGLSVLTAVVTILLFKKRPLQIKLGQLNLLLIAGLITAMFFYIDAFTSELNSENPPQATYSVSLIIPLLSLIFNYLAIRFVKKDEALVRAADRLR